MNCNVRKIVEKGIERYVEGHMYLSLVCDWGSTERLGLANLNGSCDWSVTYFPSPPRRLRSAGVSSLSWRASGSVAQRRSSTGMTGALPTLSASALNTLSSTLEHMSALTHSVSTDYATLFVHHLSTTTTDLNVINYRTINYKKCHQKYYYRAQFTFYVLSCKNKIRQV